MKATLALAASGPVACRAAGAGPALRVGAGRAEVTFPVTLYPMEGFVAQRDSLSARVLLLQSGGQRIVLAVLDITSMGDALVAHLKEIVSRATHVPADQVILSASHTFSAPHVAPPSAGAQSPRDAAILQCYADALRKATDLAIDTLQTATLGYSEGVSRVGVNRDVSTPSGWWLGSNEDGFSDPTIGVLRIDGQDGRPMALLLNATVQPSVMEGSQRAEGGRLITADLAGAAVNHLERTYGGATALFMIGAAGDQAPLFQANRHVLREDGTVGRSDLRDAGWPLLALLGERLGSAAVRVAESIKTMPSPAMVLRRDSVALEARVYTSRTPPSGPVTAVAYQSAGTTALPFVLLQLGELVLVGVQPELSASVGARIKADSPFRHTLVATMVDGAAKYLPDQQAFDRFTYEARSSPYAPGAAEAATRAIAARLHQMKQEQTKEKP